jgi:GxxExxY protein
VKHVDIVTGDVISAAIDIHRELGPGLLESVYELVLDAKLRAMGYLVERQRPVNIEYADLHFEGAFRIDLFVDDQLIVEIKSVEQLTKAHAKQLLTYLRLTKLPVGLLINFAGETLKEGVRRLVNNHMPSAPSAPLRET